jgi:hypothetical protein
MNLSGAMAVSLTPNPLPQAGEGDEVTLRVIYVIEKKSDGVVPDSVPQ